MPIPRIVWPYVITSSNDDIVFAADIAGATGLNTYTGTIAQGTYVTPELLAAAIVTGMQAATRTGPVAFSADGGTVTCTLSGAGIVTITLTNLDNVLTTLAWSTNASTQALGTLLGFGAADSTATASGGTATFTAASPITQLWTPVADSKSYGVRTDTAITTYDRPVVRTRGGQNKTIAFDTLTERTVAFEFLTAARTFQASESSCVSLERFWLSTGVGKFRYSPDRANPATSAVDYFLLAESAQEFAPERMFDGLAVWRITLRMGAYNA